MSISRPKQGRYNTYVCLFVHLFFWDLNDKGTTKNGIYFSSQEQIPYFLTQEAVDLLMQSAQIS